MKTGFSRNPGGGSKTPALISGKGTTMAAKKKNSKAASSRNKTAQHKNHVPRGYHLAKNTTKHRRYHHRNPFNMSGDFVKVAVATVAAIGVQIVAKVVPIDQSNPIVRGAVKAGIGVVGSMVLKSSPAMAEGVLLGCGVAGGLDIASGVVPGLTGGQQVLIPVATNPSQMPAGSPGGMTPKTAQTVNAIRRQLNGNMRGIRMVTGNPAYLQNPYQYAA